MDRSFWADRFKELAGAQISRDWDGLKLAIGWLATRI